MNRCRPGCSPPPKKTPKRKKNSDKKLGAVLLMLGAVTLFILILPLRYWVVLMSIVLIICGILLIKK